MVSKRLRVFTLSVTALIARYCTPCAIAAELNLLSFFSDSQNYIKYYGGESCLYHVTHNGSGLIVVICIILKRDNKLNQEKYVGDND